MKLRTWVFSLSEKVSSQLGPPKVAFLVSLLHHNAKAYEGKLMRGVATNFANFSTSHLPLNYTGQKL